MTPGDHIITETAKGKNFFVGLSLAVSSSLFIGISFILTKIGLAKLSQRAGKCFFFFFPLNPSDHSMAEFTVIPDTPVPSGQ